MGSVDRFKRVLSRLEAANPLRLDVHVLKSAIIINETVFKVAGQADIIMQKIEPFSGILVSRLSSEEEKYCKANNVSFLTSSGHFYLLTRKAKIELEPLKSAPKRKQIKSSLLKKPGLPSPTTLISPNGLDILDVLFRLKRSDLETFKSGLSFSQKYRLSQPKLSQIMTEIGASSLVELKEKIKSLPDSWWLMALRYPATRKRLIPFFEVEKIYSSLVDEEPNLSHWLEGKNDLILLGPIDVMGEFGLIIDTDTYLWVTSSAEKDLKKAFKLIPDSSSSKKLWHIATIPNDFENHNLISKLWVASQNNSKLTSNYLFPKIKTNIFRAVWDMGYGSERLREVQISALRRILNEVR